MLPEPVMRTDELTPPLQDVECDADIGIEVTGGLPDRFGSRAATRGSPEADAAAAGQDSVAGNRLP